MSGGIDSTVAAVMLQRQGYEVVGITMKTWDYAHTSGIAKKETGCCTLESFNDARSAAVQYGFPHYILDIREAFSEGVIAHFVAEYIAGRTPNPCILCNTYIKWELLLKKAVQLDCDFIATGHYVRKRYERGRHILMKARDVGKDQSYVLWGLSQAVLEKTLFPLGDYTKEEIRALAEAWEMPHLARKKESYEICFVPDNNYRNFLKAREPNLMAQLSRGVFKDKSGKVLGYHEGYPFFTIGQRRGLGIALGKPVFVIDICSETNTVILGEEADLRKKTMKVRSVNFIKYPFLEAPKSVTAKIRYRDTGTQAVLKQEAADTFWVDFFEDAKGIAPGQSAVFYEAEDVVAGGFIQG